MSNYLLLALAAGAGWIARDLVSMVVGIFTTRVMTRELFVHQRHEAKVSETARADGLAAAAAIARSTSRSN